MRAMRFRHYVEIVLAASTLVSAKVASLPTSAPGWGPPTGSVSLTGGRSISLSDKAIRLTLDQRHNNRHVRFPTENRPVSRTINDVKPETQPGRFHAAGSAPAGPSPFAFRGFLSIRPASKGGSGCARDRAAH
jgi:hypothetical protein